MTRAHITKIVLAIRLSASCSAKYVCFILYSTMNDFTRLAAIYIYIYIHTQLVRLFTIRRYLATLPNYVANISLQLAMTHRSMSQQFARHRIANLVPCRKGSQSHRNNCSDVLDLRYLVRHEMARPHVATRRNKKVRRCQPTFPCRSSS